MIISFVQFLELAKNCPEEKIILMSESDIIGNNSNVTKDYWHRVEDREGFFHSSTGELLDLGPKALLKCVDHHGKVKKFIVLDYY